jgi:biopolymer transport protein ExbB/TolQ
MLSQFLKLITDPLALGIGVCGILCGAVWMFRLIPAFRTAHRNLLLHLETQLGTSNRFQAMTRSPHEGERIDGFLATIQEIIEHPKNEAELEDLSERLTVLTESNNAAATRLPVWFEREHNILRYAIEAFPLLGILGTILPLGFTINSGTSDISATVGNFGAAIGTTIVGLICAIALGIINAWWEPSFARLVEQQHRLDEAILSARRKIRLELIGGGST